MQQGGLFPTIAHRGAVSGVTGSCHQLYVDAGNSVLIDCGLFQGMETSPGGSRDGLLQIDFPLDTVRALIVTHCHIDHVGRITHLFAAGFNGPVYCSEPTAQLLPLVLEDAVEVGITRDHDLVCRFLNLLRTKIVPVPYGQWRIVALSGTAQLQIRLHIGRKRRKEQLKQLITRCFEDRGCTLIPAFSIGRTQELLYELEEIIHRHKQDIVANGLNWQDLEIVVDSPLANRFTKVYQSLRPFWDEEAKLLEKSGRHPLSFEQLTTIDSHREHLQAVERLRQTGYPCVAIAASGMCSGGRIVDYLRALIEDARTDILFPGFQAVGPPGRDIQDYGAKHGYVMLDGRHYTINAGVYSLSGYSAHADQASLIRFVRRMRKKPREIRLVHGDAQAKQTLQQLLQQLLPQSHVWIPEA
jgi:metallo-beta-lactamase family protein